MKRLNPIVLVDGVVGWLSFFLIGYALVSVYGLASAGLLLLILAAWSVWRKRHGLRGAD